MSGSPGPGRRTAGHTDWPTVWWPTVPTARPSRSPLGGSPPAYTAAMRTSRSPAPTPTPRCRRNRSAATVFTASAMVRSSSCGCRRRGCAAISRCAAGSPSTRYWAHAAMTCSAIGPRPCARVTCCRWARSRAATPISIRRRSPRSPPTGSSCGWCRAHATTGSPMPTPWSTPTGWPPIAVTGSGCGWSAAAGVPGAGPAVAERGRHPRCDPGAAQRPARAAGPDHPVTGGYPVIGVLTDADADSAAQLRPGQHVRLHWYRPRSAAGRAADW